MVRIAQNIRNYKGELLYLLAQYSTPIVGFLASFLVMRFVEPEIIGAFNSVFIYSTYFGFLQMGVFNGLNRNLAYYKGKGDVTKVSLASSTGFYFSLMIAAISLLIVVLLYKTSMNDRTLIVKLSFLYLAITVFVGPIVNLLETLYRTGQDFKALGKSIGIENLSYLALSILIVKLGFFGFILAQVARVSIGLLLRMYGKLKTIKFVFSIKILKEQISVGFMIMINSYLYTTFFIFDEFYVANNFDNFNLGNYYLVRLVLFLIPVVPNSLTTIFYPKASTLYGASQDNPSILRGFYNKALIINIFAVLAIIFILFLTIEPVTYYFVPKYYQGIEYAKCAMWGGIGFIMVGPSVVLGVLKKTQLNFVLLLLMSALTYGLYFFKVIEFDTIIDVILYKNTIFICYAMVIITYTYYLTSEKSLKT